MAASPSQQTHWLKPRVDLGLEQHSGMDLLERDWRAVLALPALLKDAAVTACTLTADRQRGRAGEELCIFLCWKRLRGSRM